MNPSDFEEQFAAWLDGALAPDQIAGFETELRRRGFDPAAERAAHQRVQALFRSNSTVPELPNPDFFNHQVIHRIEQEVAAAVPKRASTGSWWRIPRLVWAGAASLLVAGILFKAWIPTTESRAVGPTYFAQVVDSRTFDPTISTSTVYNPADNVTVLWIDGLDYLPADYVLQ